MFNLNMVKPNYGEAKFWLEPTIVLSQHTGKSQREINAALKLVKDNEQEIRIAWNRHFPS